MKSVDDNNDHRRILEELDEPMDDADSKFVIDYYNENNEQNDENDDENNEKDILDNVDLINGDDELKELYKKLIIKKLKSDIKKMDSEKLIVDILKEAIQKNPESASNVNESLKNLLK
ncbi:hypothetical protein BCR32DRAFT_98716 [Anaeromyces robustus]|uniref:Uncharacterized protein n=1 Tax=Anaeromyces robustus TaxID=1754192 RepID=A0A1Y1WNG6_9FUNG|nr:hypothetical protein BCR32DRAFT_98716 [Anaeromyces robustus]|eukprot:ORX75063.1 hypothetical protein BCR32DRAFT_98716 [Anaeromyces robustus]